MIKSLYSFSYYKELAEKSAGHTFLFTVIVWLLMSVAASIFMGNTLGKEIPAILHTLPPISIENGVLNVNNNMPYTVLLPVKGTPGLKAVYEPTPSFPPTEEDFLRDNVLVYFTNTKVFMRNMSGKIEEHTYPKEFTYKNADGFKDKEQVDAIVSSIKILVSVSMFIVMPVVILYLASGTLFAGLLLFLMMRRQITVGKILKMCFYMLPPVAVLAAIIFSLSVNASVFQLAQFCLCGMFFQQILNNYKPVQM